MLLHNFFAHHALAESLHQETAIVEESNNNKTTTTHKRRRKKIKTIASKPKKIKKKTVTTRKYKTIGRTITKGDKSYELMFDMLLGIRISVSSVSAKRKIAEITSKDISQTENYFVPR